MLCLGSCHRPVKYLVQILWWGVFIMSQMRHRNMLALVLNSDVPTGGRFYDVANVPLKHIGSGGVKQRCGESEHPPDQDISFVTLPDESLDHYEDFHCSITMLFK